MSARIPLTQGLYALVDDVDVEAVGRYIWSAKQGQDGWYAIRHVLASEGPRRPNQTMHSFLMGRTWIDHVNGNGLDNRRANLRVASPVQNSRNRRALRGCSSTYKGVSWSATKRGWIARIRDTPKPHSRLIGCFADEVAAARAYDAAARAAFGEFAALNFAEPGERSALRPAEIPASITATGEARTPGPEDLCQAGLHPWPENRNTVGRCRRCKNARAGERRARGLRW